MLRLAFSTNAFKKNTLTEAVDAIAAAGYAGVEIMADVPHAHPATFGADQRAALHEQLRRRGLVVSNINAFTLFADGDTYHPTWIENDPALRQKRIDHTILSIKLASELAAKTGSGLPKFPGGGLSPSPGNPGEGWGGGNWLTGKSNVTMENAPPPFPSPGVPGEGIRSDDRSCDMPSGNLGRPTVSLQPGGPLIGTGISRQVAAQRYADGLRVALAAARRHHITLAIEPEPGLFIESAAEYLEFKQAFFADEPLVKMNCDIGHLFCVGDDPAQVIADMPEEIAHVHVEDIGENRVHQHIAPGTGVIDFKAIFAALAASHYAGWVTVELYPYEATAAQVAARAMEFFRGVLSI